MNIETRKNSHAYIIALLASLPVLFRGLFFTEDFFIFSAIAFIWLASFGFLCNTKLKISSLFDIALLGIVISYILSLFVAINFFSALVEAIKYLLFYLIYLGAKICFKKQEKGIAFFNILIFVLSLSSLISLLTACGVLNFTMAYSPYEIERWLNGTVQYHNAFGILMVLGFFASASLNNGEFKSKSFLFHGVCDVLLMFGLIMSYSRGSWVLVPVTGILFLIFASPLSRLRVFATGFSTLLSVVCLLPTFTNYVNAQNKVMATIVLFGVIALGLILYYAFHICLEKFSKMSRFKEVSISLLVLLVAILVLVIINPSLFPFLPERLVERLSGISFSTNTVQERFVFYNDAFKVYKDFNPVLGSGGGAWQYLYGMYQSYLYFTSQAHSYIMQVLVETGALGFLFWLFTIVMFYFGAFKAKKSGIISKNLLSAIVCAGSSLILHSFIDFDLSLPAILLILWCIFAILDTNSETKLFEMRIPKILTAVICVILALFSIIGTVGVRSYNKASALYAQDGDKTEISNAFKTASALLPMNSEYKLAFIVNNNETGAEMDSEVIENLVNSDPYNKKMYEFKFKFYEIISDYTTCMDCVEKMIELQPLNPANYVSYAGLIDPVLHQIMQKNDFKGAYEKAVQILEKKDMLLKVAEEDSENKTYIKSAIEYAQTVAQMLEGI